MLTDKDFQELLSFQSSRPVLSVYLNTNPSEGSADTYKLTLRNMLKTIDLSDDVAAVEKYFSRQFDWSGKSVAVFSCAPEGFFRAFPLAIPMRSRVRINTSPHVKPLADLLDFYGGYGVVLIDKQGARVFHFHLGELAEQDGIVGKDIKHTKRGGSSTVPGRMGGVAGRTNYVDELTERNMREIVDFSGRFFAEKNVRRILIGGTDENIALYKSMLPKSWQSLVVGSFPMSMTANVDDVLERALHIGRQAEHKQAMQMIDVVLTNTAKKKGGVHHLDETLRAIHDGRVQTLVISEGYRAAGKQCLGCGFLTAQAVDACPYCSQAFQHIPDAVELAVRRVMLQGGDVEVMHHERALKELGGIGAILRY